jgi:hypothetical protein
MPSCQMGKSAEEYYALLPDESGGESEGEEPNSCPDPGGCGGVMDAGDGSPAACQEAEADAAVAVSQAERVARQRGELPGGIARLVEQVLEPKGGGGTDHHPVFEWIAAQGVDPACLVCLTDLESSFPQGPPAYPVLWATVGAGTANAPFGAQVEIE